MTIGRPSRQWTPELLAEARRLLRVECLSINQISMRLGRSYVSTRRNLDEEYRLQDNARTASRIRRARRGEVGPAPSAGHPGPGRIEPPPEVLAERDRAFFRPMSIECDFLGSPPPGRSALDRRLQENRT